MTRKSDNASRQIIHAPMRIDWTDERLQSLSQAQLLSLLENLDHQRIIGRVPERTAAVIDQRICALLTKANMTRRSRQVAAGGAAAEEAL